MNSDGELSGGTVEMCKVRSHVIVYYMCYCVIVLLSYCVHATCLTSRLQTFDRVAEIGEMDKWILQISSE